MATMFGFPTPQGMMQMGLGMFVGMLLGMIIGFFGYRFLSKFLTPRYVQFVQQLMRAPVLGLIYDVKEDRLEPVPLQPLKHGIYVSLDRENPQIAFTHPNTTPKWSWRLGKPILLGISAGLYALAVDPKILAPFGIANLSIEIESVKCDISGQAGLSRLKEELIRKLSQMGHIEIPVGPDMKLTITFQVASLARALLSLIAHLGNAIFTSTQETSQVALELAQYAQRASALELAKRSSTFRMIMTLLIISAVLALIFMIVMPMLPHIIPAVGGAVSHVAKPV